MKRSVLLALVLVLSESLVACSMAGVDWVVDVMPASIVGNFRADDFTVTGGNAITRQVSLISTIPNVAVGAAIPMPQGYVDLEAGGGMLLNNSLSSLMLYGIVGVAFEVRPSVLIGPHVGITYFNAPDWWGEDGITFSDSTGYLAGLQLSAGDRISYQLNIDYMSTIFDVKSLAPGVSVNTSRLDMSGVAVNFGVHIQY